VLANIALELEGSITFMDVCLDAIQDCFEVGVIGVTTPRLVSV
jgi:hypothetical protein